MTNSDLEKQEISKEETPESPAQEEKDTPKEKTEEPSVEKVEESPKVDRLPRTIEETVPKGRFNKERDKVKDRDTTIADLSSQVENLKLSAAVGDLDKDVKQIAADAGLDVDVITQLARAIRGNVGVSPDVQKDIEALKQQVSSSNQDSTFEREYSQLIKDNPTAATPEAKAKLRELAFTEEFGKAPLSVIFHGHPGDFAPDPSKSSAEPSRGGTTVPGGQDWRNMSNQEIMDLPSDEKGKVIAEMSEQDPDKFDKFSDWLDDQTESVIKKR